MAGAVPGPFKGQWRGTITQQNPPIPPTDIDVFVVQGDIGSTIASGRYTIPCGFHWTLESASPTRIVVNEVIDSGNCFNNIQVTLTLRGDGGLTYDFENGNGQGVLRHP